MKRLQTKCFIASAAMHSLLALLLFITPAFFLSESKPKDMPALNLIPSKTVDDLMMGGGNPQPAQPQVVAPQPPAVKVESRPPPAPEEKAAKPSNQVAPEPAPAPPEPKVIKPLKPTEPEPKKNAEKPPPKPDQTAKEKPRKPDIQPSLTKESQLSSKEKTTRARAEAEAKAKQQQAQFAANLDRVRQRLDKNLSSQATGIDMPDLGGVGEAYANWAWVVVKIFDDAWTPNDVADNDSTVKVSVTIERAGRVRNFYVIQKSGSSALDKSVVRALERVKSVPAFPEGAKDYERTLKLNFNLKSKRLSG
jgi:protein TonB